MKKKLLALISIPVFSILAACSGPGDYAIYNFFYRSNSVESRSDNMYSLGNISPKTGKKYSILILTDVHFGGENSGNNGERKDLLFMEYLKLYKSQMEAAGTPELYPSFAICLGDVAEHGYEEEFVNYQAFTELLKSDELGNLVTYNVVGNHDLYNDGWNRWKTHCYPCTSFYKFRTQNMTYYFLDNASNSIGESQLTTLERDMKYLEKGRRKLVFAHVPLYAENLLYFVMQDTEERNRLISLLADEDTVAFADGHTHIESKSDLGFTEYTFPGYLEKRGFAIMFVDETDALSPSVSVKCFYY